MGRQKKPTKETNKSLHAFVSALTLGPGRLIWRIYLLQDDLTTANNTQLYLSQIFQVREVPVQTETGRTPIGSRLIAATLAPV